MITLIDNGHGVETPGKRSPDGLFLEYQYNRLIASRVAANLLDCGHDAQLARLSGMVRQFRPGQDLVKTPDSTLSGWRQARSAAPLSLPLI